jgi:hypothetical protein
LGASKSLGTLALHPWEGTGVASVTNPIGANWIAIVFGLGFVLSFGYWTTNFAEVQRALAARNLSAARRTPLIGAFPKLFIPFAVVIPGLIAAVTVKGSGAKTGDLQYNNAIPILVAKYLPTGMLGIAITGLLAAFMAGVAANVTAFNTVISYDLWQAYFRKARAGRVLCPLRPHRHRGRGGDRDRHGLHRGLFATFIRRSALTSTSGRVWPCWPPARSSWSGSSSARCGPRSWGRPAPSAPGRVGATASPPSWWQGGEAVTAVVSDGRSCRW